MKNQKKCYKIEVVNVLKSHCRSNTNIYPSYLKLQRQKFFYSSIPRNRKPICCQCVLLLKKKTTPFESNVPLNSKLSLSEIDFSYYKINS